MMNFGVEKFKDGVPFDPGYSPCLLAFSGSIEYINQEVNKFNNLNQKKFKFKNLEPKIKSLLDNIIAFYLGCFLWASFIHFRFKNDPKVILGNDFLGIDEKMLESFDTNYEIDFLILYFDKLEKDYKYFLGKSAEIDERYKKIAFSYKEFLEINKNFINAEKTSDLKIPKLFSFFEKFSDAQLDELYSVIENSIKSNKLELLLSSDYFVKLR